MFDAIRPHPLLLTALAFLLSGCFISERPMFQLADAAAPFGEGGRYVVYEHLGDGRYKRQEVFVIALQADRSYEFVNEKGATLAMSLHALGGDLFASQAKEKGKQHFGYIVFRVTAAEAVLFAPQCSDQDKGALEAAGVEMSNQFECAIDKVADPAGLFRRLALGQPVSKLVREQ
jgi:hypothetical protein